MIPPVRIKLAPVNMKDIMWSHVVHIERDSAVHLIMSYCGSHITRFCCTSHHELFVPLYCVVQTFSGQCGNASDTDPVGNESSRNTTCLLHGQNFQELMTYVHCSEGFVLIIVTSQCLFLSSIFPSFSSLIV